MPPRRKGNETTQTTPVKVGKLMLDVRDPEKQFQFSPGPGFKQVEDCIPIAKEVVPVKFRGKPVNIDTGFSLVSWELESGSATSGRLILQSPSGSKKQVRAFQKTIALMDPYRWMRNKERPSQPFFWFTQSGDVNHHTNQGYVDIVASALVSKLGRESKLPHFCEFYGGLRAVADVFLYNLEDDLEDIRFTNWFWTAVEAGEFGLRVVDKDTGRVLTMAEIKELMKPDDELLHDDDDDDTDDTDDNSNVSSDSSLSAEELGSEELVSNGLQPVANFNLEEAEIETDEDDSAIQLNRRGGTPRTVHSMSTTSSDNSYSDDFTIHAELRGMPVSILYSEHMDGTMDELLELSEMAPVKTTEQEVRWGAWLFQVCAALSQLQYHAFMTHNDLHTNNVLWKKTDKEFLMYKDQKGLVWRVPTFGKLFTIIDYGRAIFLLNGYHYISSDYNEGHDAYGMYNFGTFEDEDLPRILPNKSFDLCRLACSLLRGLFPRTPTFKSSSTIITSERGLEVRETDHPLFNLVWSWLKADDGSNILETGSGEEKYPGFELYSVVAATVHNAIPAEQFKCKMIQVFAGKEVQQITEKPIQLIL